MRWLIVLPFARPGLMGMDFRDELVAMGHEVRTFAYRRDNPLYKNRSTKATYEIFILRRLERACRRVAAGPRARDQGRAGHPRPHPARQGPASTRAS